MFKTTIINAALIVFFTIIPASAEVILPDGSFHEFAAFDLGQPVIACGNICLPTINPSAAYTASVPWTFSGPASLLVLDLFLSGDQFEVFDNGSSLGKTSTPGVEFQCGDPLIADIACSLANPNFSRGIYQFGAGAHSISINYVKTTSVFHTGAAVQLNAIPEPATVTFFAMGLCALAVFRICRE